MQEINFQGLPAVVPLHDALAMLWKVTLPLEPLHPPGRIDPSFVHNHAYKRRRADGSWCWVRWEVDRERANRLLIGDNSSRALPPQEERKIYEAMEHHHPDYSAGCHNGAGTPWGAPTGGQSASAAQREAELCSRRWPVAAPGPEQAIANYGAPDEIRWDDSAWKVEAERLIVADAPTATWLDKRAAVQKVMRDEFKALKPRWRPAGSDEIPKPLISFHTWATINSERALQVKESVGSCYVEVIDVHFPPGSKRKVFDSKGVLHQSAHNGELRLLVMEVFVDQQAVVDIHKRMSDAAPRVQWKAIVGPAVDPSQGREKPAAVLTYLEGAGLAHKEDKEGRRVIVFPGAAGENPTYKTFSNFVNDCKSK